MSLSHRYPFSAFYFWTYAIPVAYLVLMSYFPGALSALHAGPFDFSTLLQQTIAESGIVLRGGALGPLLAAIHTEPILLIAALLSATPTVVALVIVTVRAGGQGLRVLISRLRPWLDEVGAREGLRTWGFAVLVVVAAHLLTLLLHHALARDARASVTWNPLLFSPALAWLLLEAMFLNQGGLLEELGFRGFAQPLLQERMSPLAATLLLGTCWALWHVPRDLAFQTPAALGWGMYLGAYLPLFWLWCVGGSLLMTYFLNRTGGSALIAIAIHGLLNDSMGMSGRVIGGELVPTMLARSLAVGAAGLAVLWFAGARLGLRTRVASQPRAAASSIVAAQKR